MNGYSKYDISLYGHITIDRVFIDFEMYKSIGAMGNVWDALISTDPDLSINLKPSALGQAIVLVNKDNTDRLGRGKLNLKIKEVTPDNSKWHHIMYLNQLNDVSFIKDIKSGIISTDITAGNMKNKEFLKYIDYLFISDEDLFIDVEELAKEVKGWVVLHYPEGSYCTNGKENFKTKNQTIGNIDVLGAGDIFAASFIYKNLQEEDIQKCVEYAHKNTTKILKEK